MQNLQGRVVRDDAVSAFYGSRSGRSQPELSSSGEGPPTRSWILARFGDSLRENRERRLVSLNFTSWNQLDRWLRQVEGLRRVA